MKLDHSIVTLHTSKLQFQANTLLERLLIKALHLIRAKKTTEIKVDIGKLESIVGAHLLEVAEYTQSAPKYLFIDYEIYFSLFLYNHYASSITTTQFRATILNREIDVIVIPYMKGFLAVNRIEDIS